MIQKKEAMTPLTSSSSYEDEHRHQHRQEANSFLTKTTVRMQQQKERAFARPSKFIKKVKMKGGYW